jgi:hypothetical protein
LVLVAACYLVAIVTRRKTGVGVSVGV